MVFVAQAHRCGIIPVMNFPKIIPKMMPTAGRLGYERAYTGIHTQKGIVMAKQWHARHWGVLCLLAVLGLALASASASATEGGTEVTEQQPLLLRERLLLLDTVSTLWNLNVCGISERDGSQGLFGRIRHGRLDPSFALTVSVQLAVHFQDVPGTQYRYPPKRERYSPGGERFFDGIPEEYSVYLPFSLLDRLSQEWLGWPLTTFAPADGTMLRGEKGIYVNREALYEPYAPLQMVFLGEAFATPVRYYAKHGQWIMEGEVRRMGMRDDGIEYIADVQPFRVRVSRDGGRLRIVELLFGNDAAESSIGG